MERKPEQISRDIAAFERKLSEAGGQVDDSQNKKIMESYREWVSDLRNQSYPRMSVSVAIKEASEYMLHRYSKEDLIEAIKNDSQIDMFGMETTWINALKRAKKPKMATGGNVNNYPSFEVAKTIRVDDMNITPGYYTYMGRENGGKGVYLNVHTKQTLGFDLDMLKSIKEKHPTDIQILMKKGGRVKKGNYSYIPQEEIDYLVTEYGKKIDGNKLLDGAYAKGNTKAPKITRTQFEEEDYEFAKGGKLSYRESGENYEYINSFGIEQDDFKKIVDAYHKSPSSNQLDRIESRMTFSKMRDKYGKDKVDEVGNYIHETHELHSNMAKGGGIKKGNYSYIPQEEIDYLVTEYGKKIDGNKLLDGAYAKGNTKAPKITRTQFEEEDYEFAKGGEISVYNLRKGDRVKTRKGDIETIIKKTGSGSYETIENDYTHSPESLEFVSRPGRKMATGGSMGSRVNYQNDDFALVMLGGSIGSKTSLPIFVNGKMGSIVESGNNKEMLKEKAARMRKQLSAGERKHYGMSYTVVALTPAKIKEIERFKNK